MEKNMTEDEKVEYMRNFIKTLLYDHPNLQQSFPFICGFVGEKDPNGMPEHVLISPAYGSDIVYRYKKEDSSAAEW